MITIAGLGLAAAAGSATLFMLAPDERGSSDAETVADEIRIAEQDVSAANAPDMASEDASDSAAGGSMLPAQTGEEADDRNDAAIAINFTRGDLDDLRAEQFSGLTEKVERVADVADATKVWIATADIASAPGEETIYHVKGPLTCGTAGCELIIAGQSGGERTIFLETIAETISAPQRDTVVINAGTGAEAVWAFDGGKFVER